MNKSAIEKFAIWARKKLISEITYKAGLLGVTEKGIAEPLPQSAQDMQLFDVGTKSYTEVTGAAIGQRAALVREIRNRERSTDYKTAFGAVVEEVAYTWFNRLIAIRFMEVNDYLPSRIRVLSSENPAKIEPDLVTTPFETDIPFTSDEQDEIIRYKDENKLDELFQMLFIKQCNELHEILPDLFETTNDYTELLLTISFTDKDGVVYRLTHDIKDDFDLEKEGQVEIIGWLYQYYNSELKDDTFAQLKKNVKITKERIPAATQLFTPDWIVRYMVENSLGRLWVDKRKDEGVFADGRDPDEMTWQEIEAKRIANEEYIAHEMMGWKYYLPEAEQTPEVRKQLNEIQAQYANLNPEDIRVIDPCMGSGHILVYAFDVLMQIYEECGYTRRDAARSIITNNLYGLDIDRRAYQLAYFAVLMKARQYNRRILTDKVQLNLFVVDDSSALSSNAMDYIANGDQKLRSDLQSIKDDLTDAKEYGSLVNVTPVDFDAIERRMEEIKRADLSMDRAEVLREFPRLLRQAKVLAQKYHVVVTNPPYMGASNMNGKLSEFVKNSYPDEKSDMFSCFIERGLQMVKPSGFNCMVTMQSWMFLSSFEMMRKKILHTREITDLMHMENMVMGIAFGTAVSVFRNSHTTGYKGTYSHIKLRDIENGIPREFPVRGNRFAQVSVENFAKIPGSPVAYWVSEKTIEIFGNRLLEGFAKPRQGMATSDNGRFLRLWHEVDNSKAFYHARNAEEAMASGSKWFPYNKGGEFRKWYGNNYYLINWENDGEEVKQLAVKLYHSVTRTIKNIQFYFKEGVTWTTLSSGSLSARWSPEGFLFDTKGSTCYFDNEENIKYTLGFLNCKVVNSLLKIIAPTLDYNAGSLAKLPIIYDRTLKSKIDQTIDTLIINSRSDWDSFETSWDFQRHPLVRGTSTVRAAFAAWTQECKTRFQTLKSNEEELNRIFIDIYGLQDELTPEVEDRDVTVRTADLKRDIRSLISYAVGCMFGRYSLDAEGLVYAGGEWDSSKYKTFLPDEDNVIPICDDGYFQDDIVGRFVRWVETVYGHDTLEENLTFIADALGNKGNSSVEVIRNYFLNDFYADHCKIYQKRPIYWLFDSGKQNGFKALVYMHRWDANTIGNLRVEYLHKMQRVYEREIDRMQEIIDTSTDNREIAAATKRKDKLQKQLKETKDYDAKVGHLALARIDIDLDDGVKVNYEKVQTGTDGQKLEILAKLK